MKKAIHGGGGLYKNVGLTFDSIEQHGAIINADGLDAWFDPSPRAVAKLKEHLSFAVKTSPPVHAEGLIATIAEVRNIPKENIAVEGGSSDLMFTLFPALGVKKALILDPMYGEYKHIFGNVLKNVEVVTYALDRQNGFAVVPDTLVQHIHETKPDTVVIVNPNSPTGTFISRQDLIGILDRIPQEVRFVVDETYIDYVSTEESLETVAPSRKNLIVIKSMSKMYSLSGARVGYLVAHQDVIEQVDLNIPPFQVSLPTQILAVEALRDSSYYKEKWEETNALRNDLAKALKEIPSIQVYSGAGNFVLIQLLGAYAGKAESLVNTLGAQNIFIRNAKSMSDQFGNDFARIAVRDATANTMIVRALKSALSEL